jgi:Tfp pilus assembly protein PilF
MRLLPAALALSFAALSISTSLSAQRADTAIDPRSMALLAQGRAAASAGKLDQATDLIETALAVDPRNRAAFIELASVAERQQLPGKAIRLYREALLLEPNDVAALRGQGEALVAKGAVQRARDNLARIRTICAKTGCTDATTLAAVIAKGPPIATASVVVPAPKVTGKE